MASASRHVWRNWGRTHACRPTRIERPRSEAEIRQAVQRAASEGLPVKVVGAGHSFTDIACTEGVLIDLGRYDRVIAVDPAQRTVTVEAGMTLAKLNAVLARRGLALENLGDIAYQSVAGAISTATHGTGIRFGNLATQVRHLTMVCADGGVLRCSPESDAHVFRAAQVGLGALGILSTVTFRCLPAFRLHAVEEPAEMDQVLARLDEHVDGNDHFEFFWWPHTSRVYMKRNNRTDEALRPYRPVKTAVNEVVVGNGAFGLLCRAGKLAPSRIPSINRRIADGLGRVRVVDRSDRVFVSPRLVRFAEMEYAVPREAAREVVGRVRALVSEGGFRVNFPVEVRFAAADDIYLSPARGRDTCYIAVHLFRGMDHEPYFRAVEDLMRAYGGRPHWGKLHYLDSCALSGLYPEWDTFATLRRTLDPGGLLRNRYLDRVLGPAGR